MFCKLAYFFSRLSAGKLSIHLVKAKLDEGKADLEKEKVLISQAIEPRGDATQVQHNVITI